MQVPVILYKPVPDKKMKMRCTLKEKELQLSFVMIVRFCKTEALLQDDMKLLQMKEAMKSIYRPEPAGHIVDTILAENHVEPNHIPIKSPALAQSFT